LIVRARRTLAPENCTLRSGLHRCRVSGNVTAGRRWSVIVDACAMISRQMPAIESRLSESTCSPNYCQVPMCCAKVPFQAICTLPLGHIARIYFHHPSMRGGPSRLDGRRTEYDVMTSCDGFHFPNIMHRVVVALLRCKFSAGRGTPRRICRDA
jgi:hypothetical protein